MPREQPVPRQLDSPRAHTPFANGSATDFAVRTPAGCRNTPTVEMRLYIALAATLVVAPAVARDGPMRKGRKPLMGWNTWCTQNSCGVDWCTSAEVLDVAAAIKANGMLDAGSVGVRRASHPQKHDRHPRTVLQPTPVRPPASVPAVTTTSTWTTVGACAARRLVRSWATRRASRRACQRSSRSSTASASNSGGCAACV